MPIFTDIEQLRDKIMAFGEQLHEFAQYAPDRGEVLVAGIGEEYQQLHDAYGQLKKAADESVIWLMRIAKYLEPLTKDQHLSADDLPKANALIDALGRIFDVFENPAETDCVSGKIFHKHIPPDRQSGQRL
jgi:hypothetical protein